MLIDTWFISNEIFIYSKSDFNRSIIHNFCHNSLRIRRYTVWFLTFIKIFIIRSFNFRIIITFFFTFRSRNFTFARRIFSRSYMMSTRGERISLTKVVISKKITSNKSCFNEILHSSFWVSSITAITAWTATRYEIFGRKSYIFTCMNTYSIR